MGPAAVPHHAGEAARPRRVARLQQVVERRVRDPAQAGPALPSCQGSEGGSQARAEFEQVARGTNV